MEARGCSSSCLMRVTASSSTQRTVFSRRILFIRVEKRLIEHEDHDHEDFRWVVDFEKELNNDTEVVLQAPMQTQEEGEDPQPVPVTEMYVSKPLLYGDASELKPRRLLLVDTGATGESPKQFGFLTEGVAADIRCQAS